MEKLKLNKNSKEYKQLKKILDYQVLEIKAKLLQKTIEDADITIKKIDMSEEKEKIKLLKHLENIKKDLYLYWYNFSSFDLMYELLTNGHNIHNTLYNEAKEKGLQRAFDFHPSDIDKLKY